jgi:hypothetical protein
LAACSNTVQPTVAPEGATSQPVPTPEPGNTTITGSLVDTNTRQPYANMVVRLAEVIHIEPGDAGSWVIDDATSPGDYTDQQGKFVIPNVPAQEYVVVVGDFHVRYAIVTDTPDNAKVWQPSADQVFDLGQIDVVLP